MIRKDIMNNSSCNKYNKQLQYLKSIAKPKTTVNLPFSKYLDELRVNGIRDTTTEYYNAILKDAHKFKPLPDWSRDDVNAYILNLQGRNKKSSIETKKLVLKKYLIWAGKQGSVAHLRSKMLKNDLKSGDLLTAEDIDRLITATESPMWKGLISFLWESGARIGEVLALRKKDFYETDRGLIVNIHATKTDAGDRRCLLIYSVQYLRNHFSYSNMHNDDLVFNVSDCWVWQRLNRIKKAAGIDKPVSAHKFRHAAATYAVLKGYHEDIICKKFGWLPTSTVPARYKHLVDRLFLR